MKKNIGSTPLNAMLMDFIPLQQNWKSRSLLYKTIINESAQPAKPKAHLETTYKNKKIIRWSNDLLKKYDNTQYDLFIVHG